MVSIIRESGQVVPRYLVSLRGPAPGPRPAGVTALTVPPRSRTRWSWWRRAERLLGHWPVPRRVAVLLAAGSVVAVGVAVAALGLPGIAVPAGAGTAAVLAVRVGRRTR